MKKILIVILGFSISLLANSTRDDITQIVTDHTTALQWQDDVNISKTWAEAIAYCETLMLGEHSDWRLPNFNELHSIVDHNRRDPAIDDSFVNAVSYRYWSSTAVASDENKAWEIYFYSGNDSGSVKSTSYPVRCVRDE